MKNLNTIARPYAKAILELAKQNKDYSAWSNMLQFLAGIMLDPQMVGFVNNHEISAADKANVVCQVKPEYLNKSGENLVKLLAANKRLLIIPELYKVYENLRQQTEHETNLSLITAEKLTDTDMQSLLKNITNKFPGKTKITSQIDPNLIGGGKIKIGDRVVDSSVKARLQNLHKHLAKQ